MKVGVFMPVLINEPWQVPMTRCAIETLRLTTDVPFRLIVVETESTEIDGDGLDDYIHFPKKSSLTLDCNAAIDRLEAAGCTHVVHTGNDIFVRPGWLEALIEPWEKFADTGMTTLGNAELKHTPGDLIYEGVYGPFMMFEASERFDPAFPAQFADTDLVMRLYKKGKRSYRNHSVVIQHLLRQTLGGPDNEEKFLYYRKQFIERHKDSPLRMFRYLAEGVVI